MTRHFPTKAIFLSALCSAPITVQAQDLPAPDRATVEDTIAEGIATIEATTSDFYYEFGVQRPRRLPATEIKVECQHHPRFSPVLRRCEALEELSPNTAESWKIVKAFGVWETSPNWKLGAYNSFAKEVVNLKIAAIIIPFIQLRDGYSQSIQKYVWQYNPVELNEAFRFGYDQPDDLEGRVEIECRFQVDGSIICALVKTEPEALTERFANVPRQFAKYHNSHGSRILGKQSKDAFRAILNFQFVPSHCWEEYMALDREGDSYIMGYFPTTPFVCEEVTPGNEYADRGYKLRLVTVLDPED